jgi:hypothetical protein
MKTTVVSKAILLTVLAASTHAQSLTASSPQSENDRGGATFILSSSDVFGGTMCNGDGRKPQITVVPSAGFSTPVQFSSSGLPVGSQVDFSSNPVIPGNSVISILSIINAMPPGLYAYNIMASAAGTTRTITTPLALFAQPATSPTMLTPSASGVGTNGLVFTWMKANADPSTFAFTLRNSAGIVHSANVTGNNYALPANVVLTPNTSYTWSLDTSSPCPLQGGSGFEDEDPTFSTIALSFTTAP